MRRCLFLRVLFHPRAHIHASVSPTEVPMRGFQLRFLCLASSASTQCTDSACILQRTRSSTFFQAVVLLVLRPCASVHVFRHRLLVQCSADQHPTLCRAWAWRLWLPVDSITRPPSGTRRLTIRHMLSFHVTRWSHCATQTKHWPDNQATCTRGP